MAGTGRPARVSSRSSPGTAKVNATTGAATEADDEWPGVYDPCSIVVPMEPRTSSGARDRSLDVARGLAIVAIVLGHVERGLASALVLPYDTSHTIDRVLYLCHLATFAYLSGLFVKRAMERDGAIETVRRRLMLFAWLYLVWTIVQGSVRVAASSVANTPVTFADVAKIWVPEGQLWFLPWLVAATATASLAQPWRSTARGVVALVLAAALAVAVWGHDPLYVFTRGWALVLPFLIGCAVTQVRHAALARQTGLVVLSSSLGGAVWLWVGLRTVATTPTTGGEMRTAGTVALGVLGCTAGTIAVLACGALLARTPAVSLLSLLGRRSLEIFLAHIVVASGRALSCSRPG